LLWRLQHAAKAGLVTLPAQVMRRCPRGVDENTVTVYNGVGLFLRVRQLTEQRGEPTFVFTARFAGEWCAVTPERAKDALAALVRAEVLIREQERVPVAGGRAWAYRLGEPS
jgi:hypothetical protein